MARARTGVFRVVEAVALGLAGREELSLSLCASEAPELTLGYLRDTPVLSAQPLAMKSGRRALYGRLLGLTQRVNASAGLRALPLRAARKPLHLLCRALDPLDDAALSGADLYHSPFFALPAKVRQTPRLRRFLTVYDLIPVKFPHYFAFGEDAVVRRAIASLGPEDWALCISEHTRQDLLEHRPDLDPARVLVTTLAAADHFRPCEHAGVMKRVKARYGLPDRPYLLSLCTLEPRKNIEAAVRAFARLARRGELDDLSLVLVGTKGWKFDAIFESIEGLEELRDRVVVTGYVDDADLSPIYSGARMFVYPSHYEGFGLPVLEAMRCGIPVVCSDTSSLPEVAGDAALMVSPTDDDALCAALLRLHRDDALRAELSRKALARAATFSWEKTVSATVAAYQKALEA